MEAMADEEGISYDEMREYDRRSPIMLYPGVLPHYAMSCNSTHVHMPVTYR